MVVSGQDWMEGAAFWRRSIGNFQQRRESTPPKREQ